MCKNDVFSLASSTATANSRHIISTKDTQVDLTMSEYDEFEKFIRHREFGKILDLAGRLKDQRNRLVSFASPDNNAGNVSSSHPLPMRTSRRKSSRIDNVSVEKGYHGGNSPTSDSSGVRPSSRRGGTRHSYHLPQSIESSADLIRSALIPADKGGLGDNAKKMLPRTIGRGECRITDSLVDETIKSLAEELKYCLDLKKQLSEAAADSRIANPSNAERIGFPITSKFSKWQIDLLQEWMLEHREHPFISKADAMKLANATGLDQDQVMSWVAAARRRHMKMIVEKERRPRDFLDYLFLATDRERHIIKENPGMLAFPNAKANIPDALLLASVPMEQPSLTSRVPPFSSVPVSKESTQKPRGFRSEVPRYTYPRPPHVHTPSSSEIIPPPLPRYQAHPYDNPRPVVTPYKPKNADQVFRRGKQFHQLSPLKEREREVTKSHHDIDGLPELPPPSWSFSGLQDDSDSERETRLRANEQRLIEQYTPNGVIETPDGSLDGSFDVGDFDEDMFEKFYVPPLRHEDADIQLLETREKPRLLYQADAFNVNDVLGMPYDEGEKDYLNGLL